MRFTRWFVVVGSVLFLVSNAAAQRQTSPATSDEQEILGLENAWGDAVAKKNMEELSRVLADDWLGRYPFYVLTKAQELEQVKSGTIKVQSVTTSEIKVRLLGDVALVTGRDVEKAWYRSRDVSGTYLWMDVFAKRDGHWKAVATQETLVME